MVKTEFRSKQYELEVVIVETSDKSVAVLGLPDLTKLNIIKRVESEAELLAEGNKDLFEGIGKIKTHPGEIRLKADYEPSIVPARKLPFMLVEKFKTELEKIEKSDIITKITEPTEFINPIVLVSKPSGDVTVCLDPQPLNKSILREHYQLPTFPELIRDMKGSKCFSTLDAHK